MYRMPVIPKPLTFLGKLTGTLGLFLLLCAQAWAQDTTAALTYPSPGAADVDRFKAFTWNSVPNAQKYYLYVGTAVGGQDVYDNEGIQPDQSSIFVWGLFPNTTYYARLWTELNGNWTYSDTVFTTSAPDPLPDRQAFYSTISNLTAQVRGMTIGISDQPTPGTPLAIEVKDRGVDQIALCTDYSRVLVVLLTNNRITARERQTTLDGPFKETHTVVEYYDPFLMKWNVADANFGLLFFDDSIQQGQSVEEVSQDVVNKDYAAIKIKFVTPQGGDYLREYYMDVLTLYLNPIVPGSPYSPDIPNDPHSYLTLHSLQEVTGVPGFYLFEFANQNETLQIFDPMQGIVSVDSADSSRWGSAVFLDEGSQYISTPQNLKVYTFPFFWTNEATLVSPGDGENQIDPSQKVMFSWTNISGVDAYYLYVGTEVGAKDVYDSGEVSGTWLPVSLQPNTKYFVRLWTKFHGNWSFRDTTFQTGDTHAQLMSPVSGDVTVDPSHAVQFSWTNLPDAQSYALYVGTVYGGQDVYSADGITQTSLALNLQPNTRYYAQLWTQKASGQLRHNVTFQTTITPSVLTVPPNNAVNVDPGHPVSFLWTSVPNVTAYYLYVGTSLGEKDAYDSGEVQTNSLVISLRQNTHYFVRLWTKSNAVWYYTDSNFQTGSVPAAQLLSPANGATNVSPAVPFSWTAVKNAQTYYLYVGTSAGAKDAYDSAEIQVTSLTVNLNPNTMYYVRLWTKTRDIWYYTDSNFQTGSMAAAQLSSLAK